MANKLRKTLAIDNCKNNCHLYCINSGELPHKTVVKSIRSERFSETYCLELRIGLFGPLKRSILESQMTTSCNALIIKQLHLWHYRTVRRLSLLHCIYNFREHLSLDLFLRKRNSNKDVNQNHRNQHKSKMKRNFRSHQRCILKTFHYIALAG